MELEKPVLGICRGHQIINTALGGTLFQHIPDVRPEWSMHKRPDEMKGYVHGVEILKADLFPSFPAGNGKTMVNLCTIRPLMYWPRLEAIAVTSDD